MADWQENDFDNNVSGKKAHGDCQKASSMNKFQWYNYNNMVHAITQQKGSYYLCNVVH